MFFFSKEEDNGQYNCDNSDQVIDLLDLLNVSNDDPLVDRENEEEQLWENHDAVDDEEWHETLRLRVVHAAHNLPVNRHSNQQKQHKAD